MNQFLIGSLTLFIAVPGCHAQTPAPAAVLPFKSFHIKTTMAMTGIPTMPSEMWFRAPASFRSLTQLSGLQTITIMAGQDVYSYSEGAGVGMKFNRASLPANLKQSDPSDLVQRAFDWKKTGRKIGSETLHGRPCDVYEINETTDGQTLKGKVWLWTANGFPLRTVMQTGSTTAEMTVTDVQLDVPLPDSLFQPPANIMFQDLGAMMKNLNFDALRKQFGGQP
jgi:outer membrane lipoprotein-sorting protein